MLRSFIATRKGGFHVSLPPAAHWRRDNTVAALDVLVVNGPKSPPSPRRALVRQAPLDQQ